MLLFLEDDMDKQVKLSEAEWYIMNVLWENQKLEKDALELKQITKELKEQTGWSSGTVRTMLLRLIDKGAVSVDQTTGVYKYSTLIDKKRCVQEEASSFLERIYQGSISQFVACFAKEGKISKEEREEILQLINQMKEEE